jgi:glutaredoxin
MKFTKLQLCLSAIFLGLVTLATASTKVDAGLIPSGAIVKQIYPKPTPSAPEEGPPITTTSGPDEMALAAHLQSLKVKMYGAYWCRYCHAQEELFGKEAFALIEYIECDPNGKNAQPKVCRSANIEGYPTWEIKGTFYRGVQLLDELADASGYKGSRNFQNKFVDPEENK